MARKKTARKVKTAGKKRSTLRKKPAKKKSALKKKSVAKKTAAKKSAVKKKPVRRKKSARARQQTIYPAAIASRRGLDAASGGQAGDTQGLSRREEDSESVEELVEEGQYFEAEAVSGVEDAKDPDEAEVTTSEVPEDDVPPEYRERD